ncbi:MAG TPA: IS5 family transposase [Cellvibrionaceae bacterium]|nr:IS5 family transposase [Cellvibrionaceae bacterium]HMY39969.1 IS5 family transposase [Marinagarivorans sp.]HNG58849.1 IS5 family transposase [Cellvibrionaceae bacterium]
MTEGILWILRSGARWKDLPAHYPSPSTCWRRLQYWEESDSWLKAWRKFLRQLDRKSLLNWEEVFSDDSFASAKKRGPEVGKTKRGKGSKWIVVVDGEGIPLGGTVTSASPAEVTLIEPLLDVTYGKSKIKRLIYDKAADSDPLRKSLSNRNIELVCPHRNNRKKPPTQMAGR